MTEQEFGKVILYIPVKFLKQLKGTKFYAIPTPKRTYISNGKTYYELPHIIFYGTNTSHIVYKQYDITSLVNLIKDLGVDDKVFSITIKPNIVFDNEDNPIPDLKVKVILKMDNMCFLEIIQEGIEVKPEKIQQIQQTMGSEQKIKIKDKDKEKDYRYRVISLV